MLAVSVAVALAACGNVTFDFPGDSGAFVPAAGNDGGADTGDGSASAGDAEATGDASGPAPKCTGGTTACGDTCVDTKTDPTHCGDCDTSCGAGSACNKSACICATGQTLCGKHCVDTTSDQNNCGTCGHGCPAASVCASRACQ